MCDLGGLFLGGPIYLSIYLFFFVEGELIIGILRYLLFVEWN